MAAAPDGSTTRRARLASWRMASAIASSETVTISSMKRRRCSKGSGPNELVRSPSAMVRPVCSALHVTSSSRSSDSFASAASSGSTPTIRATGASAFTAVATPDDRPPPETGTSTLVTAGRSSTISRPQVPWPAMMAGSS
jgi:hypothetical protein